MSFQKFQDWETVGWNKTGEKSKNESKSSYLNNQMRKNNTVSQNKNVSNKSQIDTVSNIRNIEKEEETFKHEKVSLSMSKKIAQARCEKKLSQKDLANALYLPFKIIQDYEAGKAIPNPFVLNKIEKILGRVRD
jgi:putative transcription factor